MLWHHRQFFGVAAYPRAKHVTDATNASRTQLFDIGQQCWSQPLLDIFNVPAAVLPQVLDCVDDFGIADAEWFGAAIPIRGIAGDQQAALIGQACLNSMSKSTYGTGCFVMTHTGEQISRSSQQLLSTVAYRINGQPSYALEGSIFVAGVAIQWLRDQLGLIEHAGDTADAFARTGGDTQGVYVVPAFTGLGTLLATSGQRIDYRPDAGQQQRPHHHSLFAKRGLSNPHLAAGHGRRRRAGVHPASGWRHGGERCLLPIPLRLIKCARRTAGGRGNHRARGRGAGRDGRGLVRRSAGSRRTVAVGPAFRSGYGRQSAPKARRRLRSGRGSGTEPLGGF